MRGVSRCDPATLEERAATKKSQELQLFFVVVVEDTGEGLLELLEINYR